MNHSVLIFFAMLAFFLQGCSTSKSIEFSIENNSVQEVWPQLPEVPRYRYLGELHGEGFNAEKHANKSWLELIAGFITGKPKPVVLKRPYSVHVSPENLVYVADVGLAAVMVFNLNDNTIQLWKNATELQPFKAPVSIAFVKNEIWVSDVDLGEVFRFSKKGEPLGSFGSKILKRPIGLVYDDKQGRLYVADSSAHDIKVFNTEGALVETIGRYGEGDREFNFPSNIDYKDNKLYVSDTMNARIQVFGINGNNSDSKLIGNRGLRVGNTPRPKGVAVDSDENIYIVESYYGYLLVFNKNGEFLLPISGGGREIGRFDLPVGVTVDHLDRVFIADTFNGRVVMLQYLGND
ncbi:MAG: hypothetical protein ISEC1_P1705 [Thiomicrorhabdus sp.]|nr:MAG: hypothetical protein ISEC1_P1705 [Thiomicrorhabdus sp.]